MFNFLKEGDQKELLENIENGKMDLKKLIKTKKELLEKYNPLKKKFTSKEQKEMHKKIFKQERKDILTQKIIELQIQIILRFMFYNEKVENKYEEIIELFNEVSHLYNSTAELIQFLKSTFELYPNCRLYPKLLLKIYISLDIEIPEDLKNHLNEIEDEFITNFNKIEIKVENIEFEKETKNKKEIQENANEINSSFDIKNLNHFTLGLTNMNSLFKTTKSDIIKKKSKEKKRTRRKIINSTPSSKKRKIEKLDPSTPPSLKSQKIIQNIDQQRIVLVKESPMINTDEFDDLIIPGSPEL
eukprot:gene5092-8691_t